MAPVTFELLRYNAFCGDCQLSFADGVSCLNSLDDEGRMTASARVKYLKFRAVLIRFLWTMPSIIYFSAYLLPLTALTIVDCLSTSSSTILDSGEEDELHGWRMPACKKKKTNTLCNDRWIDCLSTNI